MSALHELRYVARASRHQPRQTPKWGDLSLAAKVGCLAAWSLFGSVAAILFIPVMATIDWLVHL